MLRIRDLTKVYPGHVSALTDVCLDIDTGMFGLLGPNGAGKSTLMKVVCGLVAPTAGSVMLDGVDVLSRPEGVRESLGYLPQDFGFYPQLSGRKMLEFLLELKGVRGTKERREIARELLARVNLEAAADRRIGTYSGGMRQRLGLAQAIAGDPRLVIVDEPTSGLDPEERQRIYRLLSELAKKRIVILSTHLVEDVAVLCPRFAVLRGGRVVSVTTPSEARRAIDGHIFEGTVAGGEDDEVHLRHTVTKSFLLEGRAYLRVYAKGGAAPPGFSPTQATLEDAFFLMMADRTAPEASLAVS